MNILTPDQLRLATFLPLLKSRFRVYPEATNAIELELVAAKEISNYGPANQAAPRPEVEAFSLLFEGPDNRLLPQRIYGFEHDQLGRFEMFIVPVGQKPGCIEYQVIFNRLAKPLGGK